MTDTVLLRAKITPNWNRCQCDDTVNLYCVDDLHRDGDVTVVVPGKQTLTMNECNVAFSHGGKPSDQKQLHATCEVLQDQQDQQDQKNIMCNFTQSDSDYQVQMYCKSAEFAGFQDTGNSWRIASNKDSVCAGDVDAFSAWAPTGKCGRRVNSLTSDDGNGNQVSLEVHRVSKD